MGYHLACIPFTFLYMEINEISEDVMDCFKELMDIWREKNAGIHWIFCGFNWGLMRMLPTTLGI